MQNLKNITIQTEKWFNGEKLALVGHLQQLSYSEKTKDAKFLFIFIECAINSPIVKNLG